MKILLFLSFCFLCFGENMLWLTDIHIDYKNDEVVEKFFEEIALIDSKGICITGDIAENGQSINFINKLSENVQKPIYFVLGNHDFYGSNIESFQQQVNSTFQKNENVFYLSAHQAIPISDNTALIGIDNWYDFSVGDYFSSEIKLKDFKEIKNLIPLDKSELYSFMQNYSKVNVELIEKKLIDAFAKFTKVILLIHVPPFQEACFYKNQIADDFWAPFFVHGELGGFLKKFMEENHNKSLTVLSGHTHNTAEYKPLPNLFIKVGSCPKESFEWDQFKF
jgi:predicted MPP superfamily phosphohydrolase